MFKKSLGMLLMLFMLMFSITACSFQLPWNSQVTPTTAASAVDIQAKLAIGTLMLEDTDLAVTAEQAKQLLPLWKAVKSLSASNTASQAEIQALYEQIQETMSPEQVQAIQEMEITPEKTQALMQKLGMEGSAMAGGQTLSESDIATRTAQRSQNSGGAPGMMPMGGPDMMGGGPPPEMGTSQNRTQSTPSAGQSQMRGANLVFVTPLIELLKERAQG